MKILHLSYGHVNNPWIMGGATVRAHEINRRLGRRHDVTVLTGSWPGAPREETIDGVRYQHRGIAWSYPLSRLSYAVAAGHMCRSKDHDLVVEDFSNFAPVFAGVRPSGPTVAMINDLRRDHILKSHGLCGLLGLAYEKSVMKTHRYFIAVSSSTAEKIREAASRVEMLEIVHNGIDTSLFSLRAEEDYYVLFLGRQDVYMKGLDLLFEAFASVSKDHSGLLLVVAGFGDPSTTQSLVRGARLNGRVDIRSQVSEAEKRELLRRCLAVVMPSRYEGWGIVAIEAAACGKPVIGQRVTGLVDSVRDGETGILVPYEDVDALAAAINRIVDDDELRHRMGAAGKKWARNFSWDEAAPKQEAFYYRVVEAES